MNDTGPKPASVSLSVAMATYNGAAFLDEQLQSLSRQTLLPDELVVSDDGSTDETLNLIRSYAATAPFPVRILDKAQRLGFADNFLHAAEQAHGELVALCDQDDVWLPTKLEHSVSRLLADDSLLSMHQLTMTDEAMKPIGQWDQGISGDRIIAPLAIDPLSGWGNTMVFRRSLATLVPRSERPLDFLAGRLLSHDTWLYILAVATGRVSHIAEPLILYRQHGTNVVGMQVPGLLGRLRSATTVPLSTYHGQTIFYEHLAAMFDRLAARDWTGERDGVGKAAAAAADRYRARGSRAATRAALHDGRTLGARLLAFRQLYVTPRVPSADGPPGILSGIKDLGLGVTGWGRHV